MSQTYFAILTAVGEAKLANATALGVPLQISRMAVGDGNGNLPVPNRLQTALVHETYRADLNELKADPLNASQIIAELVIPETEGGYWLREMGLYDVAGDLIAVANCPPSYKPEMAEGSGRTQVLRMVLVVSSTAAVQLKIDPSVVLATRAYADAIIVAHLAAADPHPQYVNNTELAAAIAAINTVPTGYLSGLTLSNNAATPVTDIDIAPGVARAAGDTATLKLAAAMTKRLQSAGAWGPGDGSNGLFNGARASNTWYHVFLIREDSDGSIDAGFDTSPTAANKPAGWSNYLRLGSIKTDASGNILPFVMDSIGGSRLVRWVTPIMDSSSSVGTSAISLALSVPPGVRARAELNVYVTENNKMVYISPLDTADLAPDYSPFSAGYGAVTAAALDALGFYITIMTNAASQIRLRSNINAGDVSVLCLGWEE
jgi:hypothetical protein